MIYKTWNKMELIDKNSIWYVARALDAISFKFIVTCTIGHRK